MSRRSFVKGCVALTSLMGLSTDKLSKVVEPRRSCQPSITFTDTNCTAAMSPSSVPISSYASDVILSQVALEYDHLLSAASGEPFEAHLEETIQKYKASTSRVSRRRCLHEGQRRLLHERRSSVHAHVAARCRECCCCHRLRHLHPGRYPGCQPRTRRYLGHHELHGQDAGRQRSGLPADSRGHDGRHHARRSLWHGAAARWPGPSEAQFYGNRIHDTCYRRSASSMLACSPRATMMRVRR